MTTIELDRPAPQAPTGRSWAATDLAVRWVLLAIFGLSALTLLPAHLATSRPVAQFTLDLKARKVTSIEYVLKGRSLRWSDGGLRWYAADLRLGRPALGPSPDQLSGVTAGDQGDDPENNADAVWLLRAIDAAGSRQNYRVVGSSDHAPWATLEPRYGFATAAGIATILSFFLMLGRDQRRFGNRWAWFWVFVTTGWAVGPPLFLLLEPAPLWHRRARPMPARPALMGGAGLLVALVLMAVLPGVAHMIFGPY